HVVGEVGLKNLVRPVNEIDVLHVVLRRQLIELGGRQLARRAAGGVDIGGDLGQHLVHVGADTAMLGAQHDDEDLEAVAEAALQRLDVLGLLVGDQAVHHQRHHQRGAQGDRYHHRQKEEADFALHPAIISFSKGPDYAAATIVTPA